jgi:hypothetical protein
MTSDHLGELSPERRALWRFVLGEGALGRCTFPLLGRLEPVIAQVRQPGADGRGGMLFVFNTADIPHRLNASLAELGLQPDTTLVDWRTGAANPVSDGALSLDLPRRAWRLFAMSSPARP